MTQCGNKPVVVALNGPPGSGKGWLTTNVLKFLIPDAVVCKPSDYLFDMMKLDDLIPAELDYAVFKETQIDSRQQLIDYATKKRGEDCHVFSRRVTDSPRYQVARVVILDNIGFDDEVWHFARHSSRMLILRLDVSHRANEPYRARSRRMRHNWAGDSRSPVFYNNIITAYDSTQMAMILRWIALTPSMTREEAGPYHAVRELWTQHIAPPESRSYLQSERGARFMG